MWYKSVLHYHPDDSTVASQHYVESFIETPDSGFVLGGYVFYPGGSGHPQAAWIKKVDKHGCSSAADCIITSVEGDEILESAGIQLSPNPVKDLLRIRSENVRLGSFTILDIGGKVVQQLDFDSAQSDIRIDVSGLKPGAYVIQFEDLGKSLKFLKL